MLVRGEEMFEVDLKFWFWVVFFGLRDYDGWEGGGVKRICFLIYIWGDFNIVFLRWGKMN